MGKCQIGNKKKRTDNERQLKDDKKFKFQFMNNEM